MNGKSSSVTTAKKWIDSVNHYRKKKRLDRAQAKRMVHDRNKWRWFVRVNDCNYLRGGTPEFDEIPVRLVASAIWNQHTN